MSLYKTFGTDTALEKQGLFLEYGNNSKGEPVRIRIARAGGANVQYRKRMEALTKPIRKQIANETADVEQLRAIVRQVFAETVVLGWEGVEDREGNALTYSTANVVKLFTDLPDLFDDVQEQAQRLALFRAEVQESDAKN